VDRVRSHLQNNVSDTFLSCAHEVLRTIGLYGPKGGAAGGAGGGRVAVVGDESVFEKGGFAGEEFWGRGGGGGCGCGCCGRWDGGRWSGGRVYHWIEDGFGCGVGFALVVGGKFHGDGFGVLFVRNRMVSWEVGAGGGQLMVLRGGEYVECEEERMCLGKSRMGAAVLRGLVVPAYALSKTLNGIMRARAPRGFLTPPFESQSKIATIIAHGDNCG
jgi:hypothetical protein